MGVRVAEHVAARRQELLARLTEAPGRIVLATRDTVMRYPGKFPRGAVIVKDEAGKFPRERSVSLAVLWPRALLLIGDPAQLPPIVHRERILLSLPGTLFDDVKANRLRIHRLYTQYRMAPTISTLVSSMFYDNELLCGRSAQPVGTITWVHTV